MRPKLRLEHGVYLPHVSDRLVSAELRGPVILHLPGTRLFVALEMTSLSLGLPWPCGHMQTRTPLAEQQIRSGIAVCLNCSRGRLAVS